MSNREYDNDNDNVRIPDPVKREKLIHNEDRDYEMDSLLEISKNEFEFIQNQQETQEIELIYKQNNEQRCNKFNHMKMQLNKILALDSSNIVHYELILSIIELFELGFINEYKLTKEQYTDIFKILKTIRLPPNEIDHLQKILTYEL